MCDNVSGSRDGGRNNQDDRADLQIAITGDCVLTGAGV